MISNFTPLNIDKVRHTNNVFNTVLLVMATLTTLVLVILLFFLIQKRTKNTGVVPPTNIIPTPTSITLPNLTPTIGLMPSATPSAKPSDQAPVASQSGKLILSPTNTATNSSK